MSAGSSMDGTRWVVTGWLGGAALGSTVAGPAGAVAGAVFGLLAGGVRASTGKTLWQHCGSVAFAPPQQLKPPGATAAAEACKD